MLYLDDNMNVLPYKLIDLVYADCIYESINFDWIEHYWKYLVEGGIFIVQTDWHTNWYIRNIFESMYAHGNATFVNHLVWKNEWGNHPKNRFHQCYDDIIIYCKGNKWNFFPEKIQVEKVTKNTKLNPSGRETKTATAWIDDICLTTTAKERIKLPDGHLLRWQKPLKLFDRILAPFLVEGSTVADIFMGSGTVGVWCKQNKMDYIGIENNEEIFNLAKERIENA